MPLSPSARSEHRPAAADTAPGASAVGPRVAMLVMNSCDTDARVLKEAASLRRAGATVRIVATAGGAWPAGKTELQPGLDVERVRAASVVSRLRARWRPGPAAAPRTSVRDASSTSPPAVATSGTAGPRRAPASAVRRAALALHRPSVQWSFWRASCRSLLRWRPDVIHAHDLNTLPAAVVAGLRLGVPVVYDSHELWRHRNRHGESRPVAAVVEALLERWCIRRCAAVITVSDSIADWLTRTYRLRAPVTVLRNVPSGVRAATAPDLRSMAGLTTERVLLYTGRLTSARGIEETLAALPLLDDDVHYVLLGYGSPEFVASVLRRADDHGVRSRVHHVGAVASEQVTAVASGADVAVLAARETCLSYRYCLPNKLFEAIQARVPVVASALPDMAALVRAYAVGETVEQGDVPGLAAALRTVLERPDAYASGLDAAAADLSWEREEQRLIDVYGLVGLGRDPSTRSPAACGPE